MSKHLFDLIALRRLPAAVVAAAATLASGAALAVVGPAGTVAVDGALADIAYGSGGNVFELVPRLFVLGLGSTGNPLAVTTLNPLLQYAFSLSGEGTGLLSIDYSLQNVSAVQSFNDLRLMLYVNPDGDSASYQDVLHETWGAANAGDPVKRVPPAKLHELI